MRYAWKPEYSLDDPKIDAQHRQLLELANLVLDACSMGSDERVVWHAFSALHHYADRHFDDEEMLLAELRSPLLEAQRKQHDALTTELKQLWTASRMNLLLHTLESLSSWLSTRLLPHMMEDDRRARWENARGGDVVDPEASAA